jgi:hypothetical protein
MNSVQIDTNSSPNRQLNRINKFDFKTKSIFNLLNNALENSIYLIVCNSI